MSKREKKESLCQYYCISNRIYIYDGLGWRNWACSVQLFDLGLERPGLNFLGACDVKGFHGGMTWGWRVGAFHPIPVHDWV